MTEKILVNLFKSPATDLRRKRRGLLFKCSRVRFPIEPSGFWTPFSLGKVLFD